MLRRAHFGNHPVRRFSVKSISGLLSIAVLSFIILSAPTRACAQSDALQLNYARLSDARTLSLAFTANLDPATLVSGSTNGFGVRVDGVTQVVASVLLDPARNCMVTISLASDLPASGVPFVHYTPGIIADVSGNQLKAFSRIAAGVPYSFGVVTHSGGMTRLRDIHGIPPRMDNFALPGNTVDPSGVAMAHDGQTSIITNRGSNTITRITELAASSPVLTTFELPPGTEHPVSAAITPIGDMAVVTSSTLPLFTRISDFMGPTPSMINFPVPKVGDQEEHGLRFVTLSKDGNTAIIGGHAPGFLFLVTELKMDNPAIRPIEIPRAQGSAVYFTAFLSSDGNHALIGQEQPPSLHLVKNLKQVTPAIISLDLSGGIPSIGALDSTPDLRLVLVTSPQTNGLVKVQGLFEGKPTFSPPIPLPGKPSGIRVQPNGKTALLANKTANTLMVVNGVDTDTPEVGSYSLPLIPFPAVSPQGIDCVSGGALDQVTVPFKPFPPPIETPSIQRKGGQPLIVSNPETDETDVVLSSPQGLLQGAPDILKAGAAGKLPITEPPYLKDASWINKDNADTKLYNNDQGSITVTKSGKTLLFSDEPESFSGVGTLFQHTGTYNNSGQSLLLHHTNKTAEPVLIVVIIRGGVKYRVTNDSVLTNIADALNAGINSTGIYVLSRENPPQNNAFRSGCFQPSDVGLGHDVLALYKLDAGRVASGFLDFEMVADDCQWLGASAIKPPPGAYEIAVVAVPFSTQDVFTFKYQGEDRTFAMDELFAQAPAPIFSDNPPPRFHERGVFDYTELSIETLPFVFQNYDSSDNSTKTPLWAAQLSWKGMASKCPGASIIPFSPCYAFGSTTDAYYREQLGISTFGARLLKEKLNNVNVTYSTTQGENFIGEDCNRTDLKDSAYYSQYKDGPARVEIQAGRNTGNWGILYTVKFRIENTADQIKRYSIWFNPRGSTGTGTTIYDASGLTFRMSITDPDPKNTKHGEWISYKIYSSKTAPENKLRVWPLFHSEQNVTALFNNAGMVFEQKDMYAIGPKTQQDLTLELINPAGANLPFRLLVVPEYKIMGGAPRKLYKQEGAHATRQLLAEAPSLGEPAVKEVIAVDKLPVSRDKAVVHLITDVPFDPDTARASTDLMTHVRIEVNGDDYGASVDDFRFLDPYTIQVMFDRNLPPNTKVTTLVTKDAKDALGNEQLADFRQEFETEPVTVEIVPKDFTIAPGEGAELGVRFLDSDGDEVDYNGSEFQYQWEMLGNCGDLNRYTGSNVIFRADPEVTGDCDIIVRVLHNGKPVSAEEAPPGKSDVKVWGLVVESPGGMAVDRAGNIYVSDQGHGGEKEGSVVIFAWNGQAIRFIQDLTLPGDIEVSQDGKALIISESGGKIERIFFGLSGQIKDLDGNLLVGATVTVEQGALTYPGTAGKEHQLKTNSSGRFHVMDMLRPLPTKDPPELYVIVTVEYQGNTQDFEVFLEPEGHLIKEFVFNP